MRFRTSFILACLCLGFAVALIVSRELRHSAASVSASTARSPALGTFDLVGRDQMDAWAAAGGNAAVIPVIWSQAQPVAGGPVSLTSAGNDDQDVLSEIAEAHAAGLAVYLELALQYPPAWVKAKVPQFVDQAGTAYSSAIAGADVRDWIWSRMGRDDVAAFVSSVLRRLAPQLPQVAGIRVGGGMYGELQYPFDGTTVGGQPAFWGYDAPAQTGVDLAYAERRCPIPGYVYGHGTAARNAEWAKWFLGSLADFVHWYILTLRAGGWNGPVYVLHPGYGERSDWSALSPQYRLELAHGTNYAVQMDAYEHLADAWPWSTWADDGETFNGSGRPVDADQPAWRKLLEIARQRGLAAHIMGENTGGGGAPAIAELTNGALKSGYAGIFYLDYPTLIQDGLLTTLISDFRNDDRATH